MNKTIRRFLLLALVTALSAILSPMAYAASDLESSGMNRLQYETSPYLLQHAKNPVDWYPWGEEAFARAREEGKPIFLSVGYSTCYWCQVMERESFENQLSADLLNEHFISIKVDREERPDVDQIYMSAVQAISGGGGWPMSVFLTPELKPFYGGTYFPNHQFNQILKGIQHSWTTERERVLTGADALTEALRATEQRSSALASELPPQALAAEAVRRFASSFDGSRGGFGGAPKFPRPAILELLLSDYQATGNVQSLTMVRKTLASMARGGIYDQLAGGFHRYSTDSKWLVPHFEKMLYDNAQLLRIYARAYRITGDAELRRIAEDIAEYVRREMTSPEGLFFSAQDSGVHGEEGETYVWSRQDLERVLSDEEFALAGRVYGFDGEPNFEGHYILYRPGDTDMEPARLAAIRTKLLGARQQPQPQPLLDDKSITAWNGLMIQSLAYAGDALGQPDYLQRAKTAAEQLLSKMRDGQGDLLHVFRLGQAKLDAYLDDYSALILGVMEIGRLSGEAKWYSEASRLADAMIEKLWDPAGGFHFASADVENLLFRTKASFDGAIPAANSLAVQALVQLAASGHPRYAPYAAATLRAFDGSLERAPQALPYMLHGLMEYRRLGLPENAAVPRTAAALIRTAEVVRVAASLSPAVLVSGRPVQLNIDLEMDEGWHIIANPTSLETLIPTTAEAALEGGELELTPRYPAPKTIDSPLGKVDLYEGQAHIEAKLVPVRLPAGQVRGRLEVRVKAQACNDSGRCLLPSSIQTEIPVVFPPP